MSVTKTQELRKAFMGGVAAWIIQMLVVMAWIFLGGHNLPKPPLAAQRAPGIAQSPPVFAATLDPLRP